MFTIAKYAAVLSLTASFAYATAENTTSTRPKTFKVVLDKQHVPVMVNGREVAKKTAYYGTIFVGYPQSQEFRVVFDTGSGHVFVPSSHCRDETCKHHRVYQRKLSQSYVDINHNGSRVVDPRLERDMISISYGTGEIVGDVVRETICIGAPPSTSVSPPVDEEAIHCIKSRLITAKTMTTEPFASFEFDGVLGLGLAGLALDPEFHFFGQMARGMQIEAVFSVFVSRSDAFPSEITFGGSDTDRFEGPMHWVPVYAPEQGFWKVWIKSIRVGDEPVSFCDDGQCSAIVDTGTSALGVPSDSMESLMWKTAQKLSKEGTDDLDCRTSHAPSIVFEVSGGFQVELTAEDYMRPVPSDVQMTDETETSRYCRANLLPLDMPTLGKKVFLWGAPILQKYYTSYDQKGERVGLAPAVHPSADGSSKENAKHDRDEKVVV